MNLEQKIQSCVGVVNVVAQRLDRDKVPYDKQNGVINATLALVISQSLNVPTDASVIPRAYYMSNEEDLVHQIVSGVNEQLPIQCKEVIAGTFNAWYTRYQIASGIYRIDLMAKILEKSPAIPEDAQDAFDILEDILSGD